jgi:hypothetical protein
MTIFAFERARPGLKMGWLLLVCVVFLTMTASGHATECSCRDAIPADSSANGTCTKTQNGSQSCKMDWNAGGGGKEQNARLLNELQRQGASLPDVGGPGDDPFDRAAFALLDPKRADTVEAMATLIAGALQRNAPDRLPLYRAFLSKYSDTSNRFRLGPESAGKVSTDQLSVEGRNYNVTATFGCVQFRDSQFLLMLKTQFARTRRSCDESAG